MHIQDFHFWKPLLYHFGNSLIETSTPSHIYGFSMTRRTIQRLDKRFNNIIRKHEVSKLIASFYNYWLASHCFTGKSGCYHLLPVQIALCKLARRRITCYIQLPEGSNAEDSDLFTILLEGVIPAEWANVENSVLMVKFDGAKVTEYMRDCLGTTDGEVTSTITGELLNGTPFEDSETIGVISKDKE